MNDKYITVTQLTRYIKYKIDNDVNLNEVFLKGEISNFKAHSRGHFYFTLKDEGSRINAIMFASSTKKIKFTPQDGMKVLVTGKISVFEANGGYQIYVNDMLEDGVGNLYIAFEQLKKKLEQEGLFKKEYKKEIPKIPTRVGVVTAPTGAAIKDIISTIKRRWPLAEVILFPSLVQGENAKEDIVKQIERAKDYDLDTLIVGRGGGSIEDLWPFNEEMVARAIYNSRVPIISAVGHEIDFTISDFVADLRAATPTAAAELAVPDINTILTYLDTAKNRLYTSLTNIIDTKKLYLSKLSDSYVLKKPSNMYEIKIQYLDTLIDKLNKEISIIIDNNKLRLSKDISSYILNNPSMLYKFKKQNLDNLINKLEVLNPMNTLKRGYAIIKKDNTVVSDINNINVDDTINIKLNNGNIISKVMEVNNGK